MLARLKIRNRNSAKYNGLRVVFTASMHWHRSCDMCHVGDELESDDKHLVAHAGSGSTSHSTCCSFNLLLIQLAAQTASAATIAEQAAEAAVEQAALDLAAKAFCRIAVPALLAPLALLEDLIPIVGEILDAVEIAATPALITTCTDVIEKEGSAEFKATRASESEHSTAGDKSSSSCPLEARVVARDATSTSLHETSTVAQGRSGARTIQCLSPNGDKARPIVEVHNNEHDPAWIDGWMQAPGLNCQRETNTLQISYDRDEVPRTTTSVWSPSRQIK
ncbi:hypothetical protein BDZ45DRAFT_749275 [Acephala macrosclerotiorum]|nr:hypothetical protein BDZ45DRAFT_749275 [Acephala macrosclerotiorum]